MAKHLEHQQDHIGVHDHMTHMTTTLKTRLQTYLKSIYGKRTLPSNMPNIITNNQIWNIHYLARTSVCVLYNRSFSLLPKSLHAKASLGGFCDARDLDPNCASDFDFNVDSWDCLNKSTSRECHNCTQAFAQLTNGEQLTANLFSRLKVASREMLIAKYVRPTQIPGNWRLAFSNHHLGSRSLDFTSVTLCVDISKLDNFGIPDKTICIIFGVTPGTENP